MQVLSNSFAFAYFFFGGDLFKGEFSEEQNERNKMLFEDSQEQLATEVSMCSGVHHTTTRRVVRVGFRSWGDVLIMDKHKPASQAAPMHIVLPPSAPRQTPLPIPIRPSCVGLSVQVERLSGLLQKGQKLLEPSSAQAPKRQQQQRQEMDADTLRQHTINSSVNIRQRIIKLFE